MSPDEYDIRMLPRPTDIGSRLAEVMPTALEMMTTGAVRSAVVIVVDGLGWANLRAQRQHAPTLSTWVGSRIETVSPSTTGAALATITTGALPGQHGLLGYRIYDPEDQRLRTTLKEWDGISNARRWQPVETVFEGAGARGIRSVVAARPAHSDSGLTRAILTGAKYLPGQTIHDRVVAVRDAVKASEPPTLAYLYVDELDKAGHHDRAEGAQWLKRLEQLDTALNDLTAGLPQDVGIVLTADHGMINIAQHQKITLGERALEGVREVGGEPRLRYLYLEDPSRAEEIAERLSVSESARAWVGTRQAWIDAGVFGEMRPEHMERLGDVILAARKRVTYQLESDPVALLTMVGQHGSFDEDERGIPLLCAGAFANGAFRQRLNERVAHRKQER